MDLQGSILVAHLFDTLAAGWNHLCSTVAASSVLDVLDRLVVVAVKVERQDAVEQSEARKRSGGRARGG